MTTLVCSIIRSVPLLTAPSLEKGMVNDCYAWGVSSF